MQTTEAADAVYDVIFRRRDVRREFTGGPIPDAVPRRVLSAAHAAPSVGLTQPWDFVVVADRTTRQDFHRHVMAERDDFASSLPAERATSFTPIKIEAPKPWPRDLTHENRSSRADRSELARRTGAAQRLRVL